MIIWLASYPRSGNTFCRLVLHRAFGIHSLDTYQTPRAVDVAPNVEKPVVKSGSSEVSSGEPTGQTEEVLFLKTHDMPKEDHPALYLVRDGRDAYVSYAHFMQEYNRVPVQKRPGGFPKMLEQLIKTDPFGGWSANVLAWTSRAAPTAVIRFESLIEHPVETVGEALRTIGITPPEGDDLDIPRFDKLHEEFPQFYRRGQVGAWRDEMPPKLEQLFWKRHGAAMTAMGYQ